MFVCKFKEILDVGQASISRPLSIFKGKNLFIQKISNDLLLD